MAKLLILGAGGFGRTLRDLAIETGKWEEISCLDDVSNENYVIGYCKEFVKFKNEYEYAYPAFNDGNSRLEWINRLKNAGFSIP